MRTNGAPGVLSSLVETYHIVRDYFTCGGTFAYVRAEELLSLNKVSTKLVAVVLSIVLKLGNEDDMALKPTWEVKDDGGMGVGTHVLGEECPSVTQRDSWVGLVLGQKTSRGHFWRPQEPGKPGRMRDDGPEKEGHGEPLRFALGPGCLRGRPSRVHRSTSPPSPFCPFPQNLMDKFLNNSFLIPFLTLPT